MEGPGRRRIMEKKDVLKDLCERLFRHHRESESVCSGLEGVDKSAGPHHRPVHGHNRDFYSRMGQAEAGERVVHFPKIIKDALLMKRSEKLLEKRRHALRVYRTLKEAGAEFGWDAEGL
jgi:hypothetical protein